MSCELMTNKLKAIFSGSNTEDKLEALVQLQEKFWEWDILPVKTILLGLKDSSSEVRLETLRFFSLCPDRLPDDNLVELLSMVCDQNPEIRLMVLESVPCYTRRIGHAIVRQLLPLLKHSAEDVRGAIAQIFLCLPGVIDEDICILIANYYDESDFDVRKTLGIVLECLGQINLLHEYDSN